MKITMKQTHGRFGRHSARSAAGYIEYEIAALPGVQAYLDTVLFEAYAKAAEDLMQHQMAWTKRENMEDVMGPSRGHSFIEKEREDIDRLLVLNDTRGDQAALAIEMGRSAYTVQRHTRDGRRYTVRVGAAPGIFVLHRAFHMRAKGDKARLRQVKAYGRKGGFKIKSK